jgi:hypothetical protein
LAFQNHFELEASETNTGVSYKMYFDPKKNNYCVFVEKYIDSQLSQVWQTTVHTDGFMVEDSFLLTDGKQELLTRRLISKVSDDLEKDWAKKIPEQCWLPYYGLKEPANLQPHGRTTWLWATVATCAIAMMLVVFRFARR